MNNINSQFLLTGSHYLISKVSSQISLEPLVAEMKNRSEMSGVLESYRALESGRFEFKFGKGFQSVSPPCRRYHLLCWVVFPTSYFCQLLFSSVQFSSVTQLCPTLCDPMNCSTPGLPVHHQLQESTQTHVHRIGDAIQPSHPLSPPFPPALNLSQHQSLFQRVSCSH